MDLLIVLQTHSKGDNQSHLNNTRYTGASKLETSKRCVRSLINSINYFKKQAPAFKIKLKIFDDHSSEDYLAILKKDIDKAIFEVELENLNKTGISASMLSCYQYGRDHGKEIVYFAQDDYLYEESAIEEMVDFFYQWSGKMDKPISIYPYNDPYRYWDHNIVPVRIVHGKKRHWRTNYQTAFCFMTHHSILDKEFDLFYAMACHKVDEKMEDETINKLFQEREYCLFSPIPSLALHMQYETERDPYIDYKPLWNKFADDQIKDHSELFNNANKKVLNIGAYKAKLEFDYLNDYQEIRLDICEDANHHILGSITDMSSVPSKSVDLVWASHIIEHIFWHELPTAFAEIRRVLKDDGIGIITCPNLATVADYLKENINEVLYKSPSGPITALDLIFGYREFTKSGLDGMMHKIGFTPRLMKEVLDFCNLKNTIYTSNFDIITIIGDSNKDLELSLEKYYGNKINQYY